MNRRGYFKSVLYFVGWLLLIGSSALADSGANHQVRNLHFGVSGGNVNDISRRFCCSGTLGSLVHDSVGTQYILSNNHVLDRSNLAAPGENISQPGLVDNGCQVPPIVADFTVAPKLGSNVDAAIAALRVGQMDSTGFIEDIGVISSIVKPPAIGLSVAKSGRTTGFTTGSVQSVNTSVNVQYQAGCGKGKKFVVSYVNQVVVTPGTFSAGGDSGSLVVANDSCHQPVGLLFAGSSSVTIANPIGEVLSKVSTSLGSSVSFVGGVCTTNTTGAVATSITAGPSQAELAAATGIMRRQEAGLLSRPSVIGVGVGAHESDSKRAAIIIYVDATSPVRAGLPAVISGIPVRIIETDPFVAF